MATNWQTFPIQFRGGLINNMGELQQGTEAVGSATILQNYEPSKEGGYKKVLGFTKFDTALVPGPASGSIVCVKAVTENGVIAARGNSSTPSVIEYYYSTGSGWTSLGAGTELGDKVRHTTFNFSNDEFTVFVDGANYPAVYTKSTGSLAFLTSSDSSDIEAAEHVANFKNTLFFAVGNDLIFTAPYSYDNYNVADGAGTINVGEAITGLVVFREQLIIFCENSIKKLVGSTTSDYQLQPITTDIGCLDGNTIQEIGGDIIYLAPDGIRLLSATDRIGDFGLDIASSPISKSVYDFVNRQGISFCSAVIRQKAQYRIFAYRQAESQNVSRGFLATKFSSQGAGSIQWAELVGFKVNVIDSANKGFDEYVFFGNDTGYIYRLEDGYNRDGEVIRSVFETPYMPITDPQIRKSFYKISLYVDPTGDFTANLDVRYDYIKYNKRNIQQPPSIEITTGDNNIYFYGDPNSQFNTASYGGINESVIKEPLIGSGRTISFRLTDSTLNATHKLDSAILEYMQHDRQ